MNDYKYVKALRDLEKAAVLRRFRHFFEKSHVGKTRLSRELGVSISSVERWLGGHDQILLASMLKIRHFLEQQQPQFPITAGRPFQ